MDQGEEQEEEVASARLWTEEGELPLGEGVVEKEIEDHFLGLIFTRQRGEDRVMEVTEGGSVKEEEEGIRPSRLMAKEEKRGAVRRRMQAKRTWS